MEETILLSEYTGRLEEFLSQEKMAEIYEGKVKPRDLNMIQNQYLYMLDNEDSSLSKRASSEEGLIRLIKIPDVKQMLRQAKN